MPEGRLIHRQTVPRPLGEVFEFFKRPENLEALTPASLGFEFLTPTPIPMREGALIDYQIRLLGWPLRWTTLITEYAPPHRFVDVQLRGPYSFWHHTHSFEAVPEGTRITDEVRYRVPGGPLAPLIDALAVRWQLDRIFQYRAQRIRAYFGTPKASLPGGKPMKIVVTGGSGFIGKRLVGALKDAGHEVVILSRDPARAQEAFDFPVEALAWDGRRVDGAQSVFDEADAVINFAGEPVAEGRWTAAKKRRIRESRVDATRAVVAAIKKRPGKPAVLINASAVGYYGDVPEGEVAENAAKGQGFLADVCAAWENEAKKAEDLGVRVVLLRIGIVVGAEGGAFPKMSLPFKFFAGGHLGDGRQWFPWIHVDDVVGLTLHALGSEKLSGPVNAAAPEPLRLRDFCRKIGAEMGRPSWAHVPGFALKLLVGEMAEMLLGGAKAAPRAARESGYRFKYPDAGAAIADALKG